MSKTIFVVLLAISAVGCSSSDSDGSGGGSGKIPNALSKYCTGTLERDVEVMDAIGPSAWSGSGATAPAGTTFLVSEDFDKWQGFLYAADGNPQKLQGDFSTGLVLGTDFSSSCATDEKKAQNVAVFLRDTHFHASEDLSGAACTIALGTEMDNYSFFGGNVAQVTAETIQTACGYNSGYSDDIVYARLFPK